MDLTQFLLQIRYFFIFIFLLTVWDLIQHRDRARLEIALMFGSVAGLMIVLTQEGGVSGLMFVLGVISISAQPYLLLRLVQLFRPVSKMIQYGALAGMGGVLLILLLSRGGRSPALTLFVVGYYG